MLASVHLIDAPVRDTVRRRTPKVGSVPGLRWARRALAARFTPGLRPGVQPRRQGMVAWWDDEASLDRFLDQHPTGAAFAAGWTARLRPTRSRARWPGADFDPCPQGTATSHDGLHVAVTLGTAIIPKVPGFVRASSPLEDQFLADERGVWGTAMTLLPRILATVTVWEDTGATDAYVRSGAHAEAMRRHYDFRTDDHDYITEGGFFGFEPIGFQGRLGGRNPTVAAIEG